MFIPTGGRVIHSVCPALGKRHGQVFKGLCPGHLQTPLGREINISFTYLPPFSMHPPDGGSDFLLIKLLAKKSGFIPVFIEHTYHDLIQSVSSLQV